MTTHPREVRARWKAVPRGTPAPVSPFVCAECRHAQLFAVQPRVLCTCGEAPLAATVVYAGQPACPCVDPRRDTDPVIAWCSKP